jgi:iron complex transport system substrate-binding protein
MEAAIKIHKQLGPGLLESVDETVLAASLVRSGYKVERQKPVDINYDGLSFAGAFRVDLFMDERLVVEIKSVEALSKAHGKQLLTYLRLTDQPVVLLLSFAGATMKEGIRRVVNGYRAPN